MAYDSDAQAYITAQNITNTQHADAVDAFVKSCKTSGLWALIDFFTIDTGSDRGKNIKGGNIQVVYQGNLPNDPFHVYHENQTAELQLNISYLNPNDYSIVFYNSNRSGNLNYTNVMMGRGSMDIEQTPKNIKFNYGSGSISLHNDSDVAIIYNQGTYIGNVKNSTATINLAGYKKSKSITSNTLGSGNILLGSNGTDKSGDYVYNPFFGVLKGLTPVQIDSLNLICNTLAKSLNQRNDEIIYINGDSITGDNINPGAMGSLPDNNNIYASWAGRVLQGITGKQTVGIGPNNGGMIIGLPGRRIQDFGQHTDKDWHYNMFVDVGNNYGNVVPYNDFIKLHLLAFSTNDIYLDTTNPLNTPDHFYQQYKEVIERYIYLGFPTSVLKILSSYVLRLGDAIDERVVAFNSKIKQLCDEKGIQFIDVNNHLIANGNKNNVYTDNIHLTPNGHLLVANKVISALENPTIPPDPSSTFKIYKKFKIV